MRIPDQIPDIVDDAQRELARKTAATIDEMMPADAPLLLKPFAVAAGVEHELRTSGALGDEEVQAWREWAYRRASTIYESHPARDD
jgi:hypothetical protein